MAMILSREGKDDIRVADVLRVARSAGNAIMNVYSEDPEVRYCTHGSLALKLQYSTVQI